MSDLIAELRATLNRNSAENGSNTPDFLLASFLSKCLDAWNECTGARDRWYGLKLEPGAPTSQQTGPGDGETFEQFAARVGAPPTSAMASAEAGPTSPAADLAEAVGLLEFVVPRLAKGTVQRIQVETFLQRLRGQAVSR